jgi:hypothetical protein
MNKNKGRVPLMPGERQPTLPSLEDLVPPELLNPARVAAPPGTTPAERVQAGGTAPSTSDSSTGITGQSAAPPPPTTPFGDGTTAPPPPPPPTTPSGDGTTASPPPSPTSEVPADVPPGTTP